MRIAMPAVRLIFGLHNHQPVGNFGSVFEAAYRDSYEPFLDVIEGYPEFPFVLHISGPLLEWLLAERWPYIERLQALVRAGRVEILGGPIQEPILPNIPHRDRVGQIRTYSRRLGELFGQPIRGMWLPERVWEQSLVGALTEAGIEYTVLDDFHFHGAGLAPDQLFGYYLTEDEGRLLKIFPNSERMRYLVPWLEPHESYLYLRKLADERPGALAVCADDGEKFGAWPKTYEHVYTKGWLRNFCELIRANRSWLEPTTFARALDETLPLGKIYIPDCSYREMTEWVLTPPRFRDYRAAQHATDKSPQAEHLRKLVRPGGFWRNFKTKYSESDEMYARMLTVSKRLESLEHLGLKDREALETARDDLYRGQCNCPYWHGAFGGLYLPHLRNAIYKHLIQADNHLDRALGRSGGWVNAEVGDYNLDARQEVRLENDRLVAFLRPSQGGQLYELDCRRTATNLLATLDRRAETYHETIRNNLLGLSDPDVPASVTQEVIYKHDGLDRMLVYDHHPRKAFVDHFVDPATRLDDWIDGSARELGDFVRGAYLGQIHHEEGRIRVALDRKGFVSGHPIRIVKVVTIEAGVPRISTRYEISGLPREGGHVLAVELNVAAMAGHAPDRYMVGEQGQNLGPLDAARDLAPCQRIALCDEWLDLRAGFAWSKPAAVWTFPIQTVSQSEGGFEAVYQSTAVVPRWQVVPDEQGVWDVEIAWSLDPVTPASAAAERPRLARNPTVATHA
jgi:alpha-amylase